MPTRLTPDTASLPNEALPAVLNDDAFWPYEPKSLEESGLSDMALESIVLQTFLAVGTVTGRGMTERVKLPFRIIEQLLAQLRVRQLIAHARPAPLNDFYYSLTESGQKRAVHYQSICSYTGPAPVPLMDYVLSVEAQASTFEPITRKQLLASFDNVTYEPSWLDFIGPAINSNSGIFLYGPPGNGKTTLAKCLAACRGEEIWIPHAIIEDGVIIKFFDAAYHQPTKLSVGHSGIVTDQEHDRRWIRVRRPTVVVGGELTMDHLEIRHDARSNTCEAPLQMRSNCGCLLIDDFGRQRMEPSELLNRWIIPLENRHDYLSLPTGKKFCVPFEQIILFSTNLQPESLVDEAFLRRVPFKIHIGNPTVEEFTELFRMTCESFDVPWRPEVIEELLLSFYRKTGRALRRCHPRDLLHQIRCLCAYRGERMELRKEYLEIACKNYFGNREIVKENGPARYAGNNLAAAAKQQEDSRELTEPVTPFGNEEVENFLSSAIETPKQVWPTNANWQPNSGTQGMPGFSAADPSASNPPSATRAILGAGNPSRSQFGGNFATGHRDDSDAVLNSHSQTSSESTQARDTYVPSQMLTSRTQQMAPGSVGPASSVPTALRPVAPQTVTASEYLAATSHGADTHGQTIPASNPLTSRMPLPTATRTQPPSKPLSQLLNRPTVLGAPTEKLATPPATVSGHPVPVGPLGNQAAITNPPTFRAPVIPPVMTPPPTLPGQTQSPIVDRA